MTTVHEQPSSWGIHGEVEAIAACLGNAGVETSFDALMGITATAFRTHFFRLKDNPGMRLGPDPTNPNVIWGPRYAWSSLRHNNFGHVEAAAYYYGGDVVLRDDLSWDALWKILRFEYDEGRAMALYGLPGHEPWRPVMVQTYTLIKQPMSLQLPGLEPAVTFTPRDGTPKGIEALIVRPGPIAPHRPSEHVRKREALLWAFQHGHTNRELIYETERFYAVGLKAFEALSEFLEVEIAAELASPIEQTKAEAITDIARFLAAVTAQWTEARNVAARFCAMWADELEQNTHDDDPPMPDPAALRGLAADYRRVAEELERVRAIFAPALTAPETMEIWVCDPARRHQNAQIVRAAQALERVVLERMAAALQLG